MFRWLSVTLMVGVLSLPLPAAQMHAGPARSGRLGVGPHHGTHRFARGNYSGSPYFYSDLDSSQFYLIPSDAEDVDSSVESIPPQVVAVRPLADDAPPRNKPRPLLIERQGDRYVRFGGVQEPHSPASERPEYEPAARTSMQSAQPVTQNGRAEAQPAELPKAVLVYRDGHREEIADYAIINGVIYVRGNYWQNGYWTKHVPLADLDLPATVQANQQSGVKFILPSAPNVVIASF